MISADEVARFFATNHTHIAGNPQVREPQADGHTAAVAYFAAGGRHAVEQIPVGCGKSGLITLLPFGCANGRVLVIAPNLTIRGQLLNSFDPASPECFYRKSGAVSELQYGPHVAVLDADANFGDLHDAHVAVTNIQQLGTGNRWLGRIPADFFDLIIVDEGHHNAASTWKNVFTHFNQAKVISLTATPFRADEQPVEGELIYRYGLREAMRRGYVKDIQASNVAPTDLYFTYQGQKQHHTLEEVLRLRERDWFSRGVALAERCNVSIVDASITWMQHLRASGTHHQIVAAACSLAHARSIRRLYEERGLRARDYHSDLRPDEQERILRDLHDGVLDVIVQVQMLGEGFDHPPLSVAAIFRPYRSLSPYIQFVGRAMRVNVQRSPGHRDNRGIIVSHVGLNLDQLWDDFKNMDVEDRQMIDEWLTSAERPLPSAGDGLGVRRPLLPGMHVTKELTYERFLDDTYLDATEDELVERALEAIRMQGLDPASLGLNGDVLRGLIAAQAAAKPTGPQQQPVRPQARRQAQQARLEEQTRSVAGRICQALGQAHAGKRIALRCDTGRSDNLTAVIVLLHRAVNNHLGIPPGKRRDLNLDELERALADLEQIADTVQVDLAERIR